MTAAAQEANTDYHRASHAKLKAIRVFPREIARAINTQLSDGIDYPNFTDKARWRRLIDEVMALPEETT